MRQRLLVLLVIVFGVTGCQESQERTLRVALFQAPASEALAELIPRFENEFNVAVDFELLPYSDLKARVEQQTLGGGAFDVVMADCIWIPSYAERGLLQPLDTSSAYAQEYDFDDLLPALADYLGRYPYGGTRYGLPFMSNTHMLAMRESVVRPAATALGLTLPDTALDSAWSWDDYVRVSAAISESNQGVFGTSLQARSGAWLVYEFYSVLFGFVPDQDARLTGVPDSVGAWESAIDKYDLLYGYAPTDALTWGHEEETSAMCSGLTAMDATSNVELAANLMKPQCQSAQDRIVFAVPPAGVGGISPDMGGYGLLITSAAGDAALASDFVLWATSKEIHLDIVRKGGSPVRNSELQDSTVLEMYPYLSMYGKLIDHSVYRARVPAWPDFQDVISREVAGVMEGNQTASTAAERIIQALP